MPLIIRYLALKTPFTGNYVADYQRISYANSFHLAKNPHSHFFPQIVNKSTPQFLKIFTYQKDEFFNFGFAS
jgi:hypothetical protein